MASNTYGSFSSQRCLFLLTAALTRVAGAADPCVPENFSFPKISGIEGATITASRLEGYTGYSGWKPESNFIGVEGVSACNVTVSYTHLGEGDLVTVHVWLPLENYNSRFVGIGGGGWLSGEIGEDIMSLFAYQGYAVAATDGGYNHNPFSTADSWLMESPGKLALPLLTNFAHRAVHDMTLISKHVVASYYGEEPKFSYWQGCSTGGRQGLDLAQRHPEDYDGIWASCPAVSFPALLMSMLWPQVVMNTAQVYPSACQFEAIRMAAIEACDELDGVKDGVISRDDLCQFDPETVIDKEFDCEGNKINISKEVVEVAKAMLQGSVDAEGKQLFPGTTHGTAAVGFMATANTVCTGESCTAGRPFTIASDWIRLLLKKDPSFDVTTVSRDEFTQLFHQSVREYNDLIGSNNPDLRKFQEGGKKMITWHATNDEAISINSMRQYYDSVVAFDMQNNVDTTSYYRFFEVPGATHCSATLGVHYPLNGFNALQEWVENGVVPTSLDTVPLGEHQKCEGAESHPLYRYPTASASAAKEFIPDDAEDTLDTQRIIKDEL